MDEEEVEVLIVGAGPAGLSAALFLARHGIRVLAVSQAPSTADTPRAHITNQRTMEIMRAVGLEGVCRESATPQALMEHTIWGETIAGTEIGRMYSWGNDPARRSEYLTASPMELCDLPQNLLEPILLKEARAKGADVRFGHSLDDFEQSADAVQADIRDETEGRRYRVRAKYLIGADGARSKVAKQLDLPMLGEAGIGSATNIVFSADLSKYVEHRPFSLFYVMQPPYRSWTGSGTIRMVRPHHEWLAIIFEPDGQAVSGEPPASHSEIIARMIGDPAVHVDIRSISRWQVNRVIAGEYSRHRVFCAGDAVHRHPPMNGLGSNTSIHDSFNLCWKLAFVLKGLAGPKLLETYTIERQPVGRRVVDRAIASYLEGAQTTRFLLSDGGLSSLADETPAGTARRAAWRELIASKNRTFNALGMELNQIYSAGALLPESDDSLVDELDVDLHYRRTGRPGARLPHCWLESGMHRISTLDLVPPESFLLITGPRGGAWLEAAREIRSTMGLPLAGVQLGTHGTVRDVYGSWAQSSGVREDGCVLVRPDMHVAWRSDRIAADCVAAVAAVMRTILDLAPT